MNNTKVSDNKHSKSVKVKDPINTCVCSAVRRLRIERGLRVKDMARRAGIALGSYSCLETGRYRMSLENLFRILSVLRVGISDVFPQPADLGSAGQVTGEVITRAVEKADGKLPPQPQMADVLDAVCSVFALHRSDLACRSRLRPVQDARHVAASLVQETPHLTLMALAEALNRDVSTISHSLRRRSARRHTDLQGSLNKARKLLQQRVERKIALAGRRRES